MKCFWDVNVMLDLVDQDRPDHPDAVLLLEWTKSQRATNGCAWHSLSILDYLCGKKFGYEDTVELLRYILRVFAIPPTGTAEAHDAMGFLDGDYEDAMQIAAAVAGGADCIVTRDGDGFSKSPIEVVHLSEFFKRFGPAKKRRR